MKPFIAYDFDEGLTKITVLVECFSSFLDQNVLDFPDFELLPWGFGSGVCRLEILKILCYFGQKTIFSIFCKIITLVDSGMAFL